MRAALNLASLDNDENYDAFYRSSSRVSASGRFMVVRFIEKQPSGYPNIGGELYLYDGEDAQLTCVSCQPGGAPLSSRGETLLTQTKYGSLAGKRIEYKSRALSEDGRVFFSTSEPLVPSDTNDRIDAYEYDDATGEYALLSSGRSDDDSYFLDATPDGSSVLISTRERLVGWDRDNNLDVYDVRAGGGFAEPHRRHRAARAMRARARRRPRPVRRGELGLPRAGRQASPGPGPGLRPRQKRQEAGREGQNREEGEQAMQAGAGQMIGRVSARLWGAASVAATLTLLLLTASSASAAFGVSNFTGGAFNEDSSSATQAGTHPSSASTMIVFNQVPGEFGVVPDEDVRDANVELPAGFIGDPTAVPRCDEVRAVEDDVLVGCPANTQVGVARVTINRFVPFTEHRKVFNVIHPQGFLPSSDSRSPASGFTSTPRCEAMATTA